MVNISADEYMFRSNAFESSLDEDYKKDHGIFYTDVFLAQKIVDSLNIEKDKIVLDPCCGSGSFLYAALNSGINNILGADNDSKAVKLCKELINSNSIKKIDTLGKSGQDVIKSLELKEKVDYVIGNPPYCPMDKNIIVDTNDYQFLRNVKDSGSNLFIAALYRSFELVKESGIISYIIPKNFLHVKSYSKLRRDILHTKSILSIVDIGAYFPDVRGEQIIITIQNSYISDNIISLKKLVGESFVECCTVKQSFYKDTILLFKSSEEYSIYCKLNDTYEKFSDICTGYVGRGKSISDKAISGKDIRKFGFKNRDVPNKGNLVFIQNIYSAESGIIASFAGKDLEASQTVTVFTDGDEKMCRYMLGILHSRLCNFYLLKFCYNESKLTMHADAKYLKSIPLVKYDGDKFDQLISVVKALETTDYMSAEWFDFLEALNKLVYEIYRIDKKEADFIDKEMIALQSKRWRHDK